VVDLVDEFQAACFPNSVFLVALLPKHAPSPKAARPDGLVEETHTFPGRAKQFESAGRSVEEVYLNANSKRVDSALSGSYLPPISRASVNLHVGIMIVASRVSTRRQVQRRKVHSVRPGLGRGSRGGPRDIAPSRGKRWWPVRQRCDRASAWRRAINACMSCACHVRCSQQQLCARLE